MQTKVGVGTAMDYHEDELPIDKEPSLQLDLLQISETIYFFIVINNYPLIITKNVNQKNASILPI